MGFNEKVQAYIAAKYYMYLTKHFGARGEKAFIHATQYYGEQRGRRMAQRAIRDGQELTLDTYLRYGEWVNTEEMKALGCANNSEVLTTSPDYIKRVTICPWNKQFSEMGLTDAGELYCRHIDSAICRGFNPSIDYRVPQSLNSSSCCYHIVRDVNLGPGPWKKRPEYLRGFDYHCGHYYWSYREITQAIFGQEGTDIAEQILADFRGDYGAEMTEKLESYRHTNFNICDD